MLAYASGFVLLLGRLGSAKRHHHHALLNYIDGKRAFREMTAYHRRGQSQIVLRWLI